MYGVEPPDPFGNLPSAGGPAPMGRLPDDDDPYANRPDNICAWVADMIREILMVDQQHFQCLSEWDDKFSRDGLQCLPMDVASTSTP